MKYVRRPLDGQDGVQVVAVPLHAVVVDVAGAFHGDILPFRQLVDVLHHRVDGKSHRRGDGIVTGMALMCAAVLAVQQVGVDRQGAMAQPQMKHLVWNGEKFSAVYIREDRDEISREESFPSQDFHAGFRHLHAHADLLRQFLRSNSTPEFPAVPVLEIGQHREGGRLQLPCPDGVGQKKSASADIRFHDW